MKLSELEIGDRFYYPGKKDKRYKVLSKNLFNSAAGTATRDVLCENDKKQYSKQSKKEVVKL